MSTNSLLVLRGGKESTSLIRSFFVSFALAAGLLLTGCVSDPASTSSGSSGGGGGAYCSTGYCYSYLEGICCPKSAQYACGGKCYTYSGGGGCSSYKTTCY